MHDFLLISIEMLMISPRLTACRHRGNERTLRCIVIA